MGQIYLTLGRAWHNQHPAPLGPFLINSPPLVVSIPDPNALRYSSTSNPLPRFSVAPMMDWTDRHCRYFLGLLSKHALLYTEMVTTQ